MNKGFYYLAPAMLILALGLVILPGRKNITEVKPHQLLLEINDQTRFLSTDEVAKIIIDKDPFYLLVDVRKPEESSAFTLEKAVNMPISDILRKKNLEELEKGNRHVVFFCNGDILSEQAWLLLHRKGLKKVFVMKGGVNRWFTTIITPVKPTATASDAEFRQYRTRMAASLYFTGGGLIPVNTTEASSKENVNLKTSSKMKRAEGGC